MAMFKFDGPSIMMNGEKYITRLVSGKQYVTAVSPKYCRRLAATLFMRVLEDANCTIIMFYQQPMPHPKPSTMDPLYFVRRAIGDECEDGNSEWFADMVNEWLPRAVLKCLGP
jgi:hypothetical protein